MKIQFILNRMKKLGMDNAALSRISGVSEHTLGLIMRGMVPGRRATLIALAHALECRLGDIVDVDLVKPEPKPTRVLR